MKRPVYILGGLAGMIGGALLVTWNLVHAGANVPAPLRRMVPLPSKASESVRRHSRVPKRVAINRAEVHQVRQRKRVEISIRACANILRDKIIHAQSDSIGVLVRAAFIA